MSGNLDDIIAEHYRQEGLAAAILAGLEANGADLDALTPEDLAPVDEFHTAGRITTLRALDMTPLKEGMHVLDAGCGIGGTARCLAREYGCRVTGIDLTPDYIEVARMLTERMGLGERCRFDTGSATDLPYENAAFDAGVTFHAAMNIEDRPRFYSELARVMKPGAPLCVYDVMKGPAPGMVFPVPWAETEATSFLKTAAETRALLEEAGFTVEKENNLREFAIEWFRDTFTENEKRGSMPPLGLHLLVGANAPEKFANYLKAAEAHQIEPVIQVARRG
ncbi:MAG: class I SAM-dependent methyltransferase [Alphaproteobacteria bacterium]